MGRDLFNLVAIFFLITIYKSHCPIGTIYRSHYNIQLIFNFFFTLLIKSFQFQLNKLFLNRPVVLGSFQNRLSRNNVKTFHQYYNHQEFELLNFFFFFLVG